MLTARWMGRQTECRPECGFVWQTSEYYEVAPIGTMVCRSWVGDAGSPRQETIVIRRPYARSARGQYRWKRVVVPVEEESHDGA